MAYDAKLAGKVRKILRDEKGYTEKKMFGGVCFLLNGNMACGILNDELIVRVGPKNYDEMLQQPHTRKFDITGRAMKGWIMVKEEGLIPGKKLKKWVAIGADLANSLPKKKK